MSHPNPLTQTDKPHQHQSFDTSTGNWLCCHGQKMIQKLHQLANGWLFWWRAENVFKMHNYDNVSTDNFSIQTINIFASLSVCML